MSKPGTAAVPGHDIVVVGGSAGGVEALMQLVPGLPRDLPAAVFVVLHVPADGTSALPEILRRCGGPPAVHPRDGDVFRPGHTYVAPPDCHLLVKRGYLRLVHGPRENGHRPAIDPLFRSAARSYGRRVVGVVLSGSRDDGTACLMAIKQRGGVALVQDPAEALYEDMPRNAIENVPVDQVLPLAGLARAVVDLAHQPAGEEREGAVTDDMELESEIAEFDMAAIEDGGRPGTVSAYTCPECNGTLWELQDGDLIRFRCRVGHAFSVDSLLAGQSEALEDALWTAFRALEARAALAHRVAERMRQRGHALSRERFEDQARDAEQQAALIRQVLLKGELSTPPKPGEAEPTPSPNAAPPAPGKEKRAAKAGEGGP
jgi:two-component system chemotaxis response regulator CheB